MLGVKWYRYLDLKHHRDRHGHRNDRECTESCEVPCVEHKFTSESVEALINTHLEELDGYEEPDELMSDDRDEPAGHSEGHENER